MTLLSPLYLLLLLAAAPIAWAFLARRRAPRKIVGSIVLLREAAARAEARRVAPRIRRPLSLALTLLALLAAVLGLAVPRCGELPPGRLMVVVDVSSSVGAEVDGRTRLARALDVLDGQLKALADGTSVALITASDAVIVQHGLTRDVGAVQATLRTLTTGGGDGALTDALRLADSLCLNADRDGILLIGDGDVSGVEPHCPVQSIPLEPPVVDVGFTSLTARRADALGLLEVQLGVSSTDGADVEVALRRDGRLVDTVQLSIPSSSTAWALRRLDIPEGRVEAMLVDHQDANPSNDRAIAEVIAAPPVSVLLITEAPDGFLATALGVHPGVALSVLAPDELDGAASASVVFLEADVEPPAAPVVVAFGAKASERLGFGAGAPLLDPHVTRWAFDDPLLRYVELDGMSVREASPLAVPEGGTALVLSDDRVLVARQQAAAQQRIAFGFEPAASDLVLRVGFLHLLANILVEGTTPVAPFVALGPGDAGEVLAVGAQNPWPAVRAEGAAGWPWWAWLVLAATVLLAAETLVGPLLAALERRREGAA